MYGRTDLTLGEFANELAQLRVISKDLYPEFFDIKLTSLKLTKRYIELETKTHPDSFCEKDEIFQEFDFLTDCLNVLL